MTGNSALPKETVFDYVGPCACYGDNACQCGREERALRNYAAGVRSMPTMTPAEREWCKREILDIEGYDEDDTEGDDAQLASTVIRAWTDYARDKGFL